MNNETYDVIVVGGGAAGCVVAGRLAKDAGLRVLLLEAGEDDSDPLIHIPAGYAKILQKDKHVWSYDTVPQPQLDGKTRRYRSGKVIGGGSSINAMCYVRGQERDYAAWQEAAGEAGNWSYSDLLPHFIAQECSDSFHNEYHGVSGNLKVSMPKGINELNQGCLKAFQEFGLPYNPDYNGASQIGVSPVQGTFSAARRCSSADAHLRPAEASGKLTVITGATVSKVLFSDGAAVGVSYVKGGKHHAYANEVVLSAGAIHTPKILMHSGIGDAEHLGHHGIPVQFNSPEVGKNLQDHPIVPLKAYCNGDLGYQKSAQGMGALKAGMRYVVTKDGPAAGSGIETVSYWDPDDLQAEPTIQCYHVPIISEDGLSPTGTRSGITFELVVLQPRSRGDIQLANNDPLSMPLINPNFMADEYDIATAVKSVRSMRDVMKCASLASLIDAEMAPGSHVQSDTDLRKWVRQVTTTMWHPVGTCRMGSDAHAVVDARLRVNGVRNLRVIDASIMPNIVSGNTNAPTMALARHGADMLIADLRTQTSKCLKAA
jgi:choline dehydrogenase-like flavoprotein